MHGAGRAVIGHKGGSDALHHTIQAHAKHEREFPRFALPAPPQHLTHLLPDSLGKGEAIEAQISHRNRQIGDAGDCGAAQLGQALHRPHPAGNVRHRAANRDHRRAASNAEGHADCRLGIIGQGRFDARLLRRRDCLIAVHPLPHPIQHRG